MSNKSKIDEKRTSFSTFFEISPTNINKLIEQVKNKILSITGIPAQYSEPLQGQWYMKNGFYNDHYDACDTYEQFNSHHGNRTWTCMVTLNEVEEGGETCFPTLQKSFKPKIGQALIWYNLNKNGLAHPLSLHSAQPVQKGEKFIITQWFHQCAD